MVIFHSYVKLLEGIWHEVIGAKTTSHLGLLLLLYSSQRLVLAGCRRKHGRNMTEIDQIKCKRGEPLKKNQVWQYCNVHIRTVSLFKNGRHILKTQHSQFQSDIDQWESPCALMDQAGSGGAPIMHPEAWPDMSGRWPGRWLPSFGGSIHQPFTNHSPTIPGFEMHPPTIHHSPVWLASSIPTSDLAWPEKCPAGRWIQVEVRGKPGKKTWSVAIMCTYIYI